MSRWKTPAGTSLRPFQVEGVLQTQHDFYGRVLWSDEVGLGKTLQSYFWAWKYLPDDPPGPIVIVCPAHLRIMWQREIWKHFRVRAEILRRQKCPAGRELPEDPNHTYIIGYNTLTPPHWKSGTPVDRDSWIRFLSRQNPRLVIGDEGHYLKNHRSARSRAFKRMSRKAPHCLVLTGTPMPNKPVDLWNLLNILRPELYPNRFEFCTTYTFARKHWFGWQFNGAKDLDLLHSRLSRQCMIRRRKADVLEQLPSITHTVVPVEVDLTEYRKAEENFLGWLEEQSPLLAKRAARAAELAKMNALIQMAGRLKVKAVSEWTEDLLESTDGKVLLGAIHYSVTGPLMKELGRKAVLVDGRMTDREKQEAFDRFNNSPSCRVLVGNIQAAGTGWSCTSTSDVAVCELPWVPADVVQFAGRCHGIQRGKEGVGTHVRYLVAWGTIEEDLCRVLEQKVGWANLAVDGVSGSGGLDIHSQTRRLMRDRHAREGRRAR